MISLTTREGFHHLPGGREERIGISTMSEVCVTWTSDDGETQYRWHGGVTVNVYYRCGGVMEDEEAWRKVGVWSMSQETVDSITHPVGMSTMRLFQQECDEYYAYQQEAEGE